MDPRRRRAAPPANGRRRHRARPPARRCRAFSKWRSASRIDGQDVQVRVRHLHPGDDQTDPADRRTPPAAPGRSCGRRASGGRPGRRRSRSSGRPRRWAPPACGRCVIGAIDRKATHRSSRHTNRPGNSPSMILVNTVGMPPILPYRRWPNLRAPCQSTPGRGPATIASSRSRTSSPWCGCAACRCSCGCSSGGTTGRRRPRCWASLGTTDFLDGYIARHFDQGSNLGKVLDPIADRLLFFVGVGGILVDGSVPTWFAVVVLVREAVVSVATLVLAAMGARRIDVTWYGKAGTFGLMVAFPLFLAAESTFGWRDTGRRAGVGGRHPRARCSACTPPPCTCRSPSGHSPRAERRARVRRRRRRGSVLTR